MDKKVQTNVNNEIVAELATENGLNEAEARSLWVIFLRRNRVALKTAALAPFTTPDLS